MSTQPARGPLDLLTMRRERFPDRFWTEGSIGDLHIGWRRRELDAAVARGEVEVAEQDGTVGYRAASP